MARMKPSRAMRIGMMLGAAGFMIVIVTTGLWFADIGGWFMPMVINAGAVVAALGAIVLVAGGIWYVRRHRNVVGRRRGELEKIDDAKAADAPAEKAELPTDKRGRDPASTDDGAAKNAAPATVVSAPS